VLRDRHVIRIEILKVDNNPEIRDEIEEFSI